MKASILYGALAFLFPLVTGGTFLSGCGGASGLYQRTCSQCHDSGVILHQPRTRTEWEVIVKRMSENRKGTPQGEIPPAEQAEIVDYLVKEGVKK